MNDGVKKFFGWLLMIIGGLFALLTGGCGLILIGASANANVAGIFLMITGIPCLVGCGLFVWEISLVLKKMIKLITITRTSNVYLIDGKCDEW